MTVKDFSKNYDLKMNNLLKSQQKISFDTPIKLDPTIVYRGFVLTLPE